MQVHPIEAPRIAKVVRTQVLSARGLDTGDISTHCENGLLMVIIKKRMLPEKKTTSAALLPIGRHLGGLDKDGEERKREGEEDWFADV